jgi:hypothetical protein
MPFHVPVASHISYHGERLTDLRQEQYQYDNKDQ